MEAFIETNIVVKAPFVKVWDALINADQTEQYMY